MKVKTEKIIRKEDSSSNVDKKIHRKEKLRTILSIMVLIMGILLMLYPKLENIYEDYQQKMLIKRWQESFLMINTVEITDEVGVETDKIKVPSNIDSLVQESDYIESTDIEEVEENDSGDDIISNEYIEKDLMGILTIDVIDLKLPILKETTKENLSIAITTIEPTSGPGEVGNFAIAGHRSHDFGRNFNRLDEIKEGDLIEVDVGITTYTYEATEKIIVKPKETWVLNGDDKSKEITLVTCHPLKNPTHRLIIKGRLIE